MWLVGEGAEGLFVLVLRAVHEAMSDDVELTVTVAARAGELVVGVQKRSGVETLETVAVLHGSIGAHLDQPASIAAGVVL